MSEQDIAVLVSGVSKQFRKSTEPANTLKERIISWRSSEVKTFNALTGVDFDVKIGETIGILGHNGSGKSTLLKTIAGTLRPSQGSVKVRGRLSALLELGAGFHPDLTGKENIYLNGSVLGFSAKQVDEIFDEIVEFSELHNFIHTQVKHYSSGMYARLGFAVAINLQPDVLLVDEVLAVGDEAFQRKCIDKINRFQEQKRTLILVTHSPDQVMELCDRVVVLDHGHMIYCGDPKEAVDVYRGSIHGEQSNLGTVAAKQDLVEIKDFEVAIDTPDGKLRPDQPAALSCLVYSDEPKEVHVEMMVRNPAGIGVMHYTTSHILGHTSLIDSNGSRFTFSSENLSLDPGVYTVTATVHDPETGGAIATAPEVRSFEVLQVGPLTGIVYAPTVCGVEKL